MVREYRQFVAEQLVARLRRSTALSLMERPAFQVAAGRAGHRC